MTSEEPGMDVQAAVSAIDRALAYTQPLKRRTEGLTWLLFGLSSGLFLFSYVWLYQNGYDDAFGWFWAWLVVYAALGVGAPLMAWRVAGVVVEEYAVDVRKLAATVVVVVIALFAFNAAVWFLFGETKASVAASIVLLGVAPWGILGYAQWSRLSPQGQRATVLVGFLMALAGVLLVYLLDADATAVNRDVVAYAVAVVVLPVVGGLWRMGTA